MTGLEIENWIEKRGRTVRKFRSTRPRTESNFRFGLTSCRSQNLPSEVRSLLCQVFDSFSVVTSSSSHHASHLRGFIRSLTRRNWSFHSTRLTMSFFLLRQEIFGRYRVIISEWMGKRCWPWDHQWSRTWQKESLGLAQFDKEHFFGTQGPRFSTARHQSGTSAGHAIVWSIVFLFAERNFRLCVNRNFDTIFDPVLPEPNRIFGLLNLSIGTLMSLDAPELHAFSDVSVPGFTAPSCTVWRNLHTCTGKECSRTEKDTEQDASPPWASELQSETVVSRLLRSSCW